MAEYSFLSVWELEAPIEAVWAEISRPESYPAWFRFITSATLIEPGDEAGVDPANPDDAPLGIPGE